MTVLITGGTGFIGAGVVRLLHKVFIPYTQRHQCRPMPYYGN